MNATLVAGLLLPLLGTSLGSALVFCLRGALTTAVRRSLTGFAAGVMVAASVWSLLIPALEESAHLGRLSFVPAALGFWAGILFLLLLDSQVPHLHLGQGDSKPEGRASRLKRTTLMLFAIVIHNIPEGMAVGVVLAALAAPGHSIGAAAALSLCVGIALQNIPEGAIISLPLHAEGVSKPQAFLGGVASGIVEPLGAAVTILAASQVLPLLPYLLSFAAGAMIYVVVEELIPEMSEGEHSNIGVLAFALGFSLMMALDVALG